MQYIIVNILILRYLIGYKELLVTLLIVTISFPITAQEISPSKILLTFSEPMSRESIFDPGNYKVTANEIIPVEVIKVGLVEGDSAVVLFIQKEDDWLSFQVTVYNLKDKAGNMINDEKNYAEIGPVLKKNIPLKLLGDK
jgi:hypothetical protein